MAAPAIPIELPTDALLRLVSPALVLLSTISIIPARPSPPQDPSPITSVVVATRTPRRALILSLVSLAGLSYLADGLTFVAYAVLNKTWPHWTGIDIGAIEGVVAFFGLAALGAWKDVHGVEVWTAKRVNLGIHLSLLADIALVVMLGLNGNVPFLRSMVTHEIDWRDIFSSKHTPPMALTLFFCRIPCTTSNSFGYCVGLPASFLRSCPTWR